MELNDESRADHRCVKYIKIVVCYIMILFSILGLYTVLTLSLIPTNKLWIETTIYDLTIILSTHSAMDNFVINIEQDYPFRYGWSFDDYKSIMSEQNAQVDSILKLTNPQSLIEGFKYHNRTFPFTNPSFIDIDTVSNYKQLILSSINLTDHRNIIQHTQYILIGSLSWNQCKQSIIDTQSYFHFDNVEDININNGNGIVLLDKNFNILQYIILKQKYVHAQVHVYDCRLFHHNKNIFAICIHGIGERADISKLVWKEERVNNKLEMVVYLDDSKEVYYKPNDAYTFGSVPRNLIPLVYNETLYFQWEIQHTYFIEVDLLDNTQTYAFHNAQSFHPQWQHHNVLKKSVPEHMHKNSYHQNCGFIHLTETNEFLAVGHLHYDLYDSKEFSAINPRRSIRRFGIKWGHHYTHFFYTISDKPPFHMKRMSVEFCFNSPFIKLNSKSMDCDVIQFVSGMVEKTVDDKEYLFITYGINDCVSSIVQLEKQFVIDLLMSVEYETNSSALWSKTKHHGSKYPKRRHSESRHSKRRH
eukprot:118462_1